MTRVVGYVRVSTEEQAGEGISLEAQRAKLEAYAVARDLELVGIREDAGVSAKSLERPGLQAALGDLDAGRAEGLLIAKLDRLSRNVADFASLIEARFQGRFALLSVSDSIDTGSASGRLMLNVVMSVAQWEREIIAERTADALKHLKSKGVRLGGDPVGVRRVAGVDQVVPEELAAIARMVELRAAGSSYHDIAAELERAGVRAKRGGRWTGTSVRRATLRYQKSIAGAVVAK